MTRLISWPVLPVSFQEWSGLGVDLFLTQVLNVKLITKLFLVLECLFEFRLDFLYLYSVVAK